MPQRVVIVQYAGDYREAFTRLANGGSETYYAQRYSVSSIESLRQSVDELSIVTCITDSRFDEVLPNGVRAIGAGLQAPVSVAAITRLVAVLRPTELVLCTPMAGLFRWAIRNRVRTLALLAGSFQGRSLRVRARNWLLARLLNHPGVEWVANHNINASKCLRGIGVGGEKIIPWDWAVQLTPDDFPPRSAPPAAGPHRLIFAGKLIETKGAGDLLRAVAELLRRRRDVTVQLAGSGATARYVRLAQELGIADRIEFLGLVANDRIVHLMRAADQVVIPSRHEYPEGLPLTIYEALCSRTPIVASDHPMFRGKLTDRESAVIFPAGNALALADAVEAVADSAELYCGLSNRSAAAWSALQVPVKYADLLRRWVTNSQDDRDWLFEYRLGSGRYQLKG